MEGTILLFFVLALPVASSSQSALEYYNSDIEKFRDGYDEEASADLNKAIELDPNYSDYYEGMGQSKIELGQKAAGCVDFRVAANMKNPRAIELVKEHCDI